MRHRSPFFLLLLMIAGFGVQAQQLAYVYIQGDKQTPFYVKLEGAMQERYGKNYCIMSQMAPGPAHLEILFQQNAFPAQQFTILVPEGGSRGFMLVQRNGAFSLYDLQQQFYIQAGNTEADDHLPAIAEAPPPPAAAPEEAVPAEATAAASAPTPTPLPPPPVAEPPKPKQKKKKKPVAEQPVVEQAPNNTDPRFLQNIELGNPHTAATGTAPAATSDDTMMTEGARTSLASSFRNSDCPEAMDNAAFEKVYKAMMEKSTDEERIALLEGQMDKCYKCWHARTLGNLLTEDAARYTFLKKVYPRITDQQAFPLLDDILRSEVWKAQFQQLVHH